MRNYIQRVSSGLLLIICMLAGCGDVDGPGAAVESVKVTGAPVGPVLSGASLQLAATTLDASGDAVTGRSVSWRTSDSTVATVSPQGLVSATGVGTATITASAEGKEGTAPLDVRAGGRLGREGGTLTLFEGAVSIVAPANPSADTVTVLVRPAAAPLPDARLVPGTVFEVGPERIPSGWRLSLRYDPARLPPGTVESGLQVHQFIGGAWLLQQGSRAAPGGSVAGNIGTAGVYAVMSPRVGRVTLGGPLHAGAALYAGQTGQLAATLLNVYGDTLRGWRAAWSSSDPTRAAVDGSGRVTALSAGEVTITATSEEKSAEVVLTIFARAVADWSRASEWTTTQGNARRSGHVAATLDPSTFRELWVADVADDRALTPVVAGDGKVFVSTAHYTAPDRLLALDSRTGATVWSRDFGGAETVSQPAYGDGRVYATTSGEITLLWSLDPRDGAVRFRTLYASGGAPVVVDGGVYTADSRGVYRYDAITGARSYHVELPLSSSSWSPAVANGLVYAYDGNGLAALHSRSGAVAFRITDPRFVSWNAPVLDAYGNLVAVGQRRLFLLGMQNRQVGWEWAGDFRHGSPTVADRVVYAFNGDYLEARETGRGALVWAWKPPEGRPEGATVATDNIVFVGSRSVADRKATYALDARTGKQVWSYPAGGYLALSSQGILFIAQSNGKLAAISVR